MNKAFTRLIKIGGLLREVNFRRLSRNEASYHVDLTDERGTRYMFIMLRDGDGWKLPPDILPSWVAEAGGLFSEAIQQGEAAEDSQRTA